MTRELADVAAEIMANHVGRRRSIIAVVGPPATGKSTFAKALQDELTSKASLSANVIPMDGFHLDNLQLDRLGLRHKKGAPETFDFDGFVSLLRRVKMAQRPTYYPIFDRSLDKAIAGAGFLFVETDVVIVEGNYLLLDEVPWHDLQELFDYSIYLDTPFETLEERLIERWVKYGHSQDAAKKRAYSNDIPNAHRVVQNSLPATTTLRLQ
jgi:pantothenate kinase